MFESISWLEPLLRYQNIASLCILFGIVAGCVSVAIRDAQIDLTKSLGTSAKSNDIVWVMMIYVDREHFNNIYIMALQIWPTI